MVQEGSVRAAPGFWLNIENRMGAVAGITDYLGHYPSAMEANKMGLGGLLNVIYEKDGGWQNFREYMGYDNERVAEDFWLEKENRIGAICGLISKLGHYPTVNEASKNGLGGLVNVIYEKDGGWVKFRDMMGYDDLDNVRLPSGYLKKVENGMSIMQGLIDYLGRYPNVEEVQKTVSRLYSEIIKKKGPYGGWYEFKKTMGYEDAIPRGFFKKKENGRKFLLKIITGECGGEYPTSKYMKEKYPTLFSAIIKKSGPYGGWEKFRADMGYGTENTTENLIEKIKSKDFYEIIKYLGNDRIALADIFAVKYGVERKKILDALNRPSMRDYMGGFTTGITGLAEWEDLAGRVLPFDRDGKIRDILEKALFDSVMGRLGPRPKENEIRDEMEALRSADVRLSAAVTGHKDGEGTNE